LVSIIILSYNTKKYLYNCLKSLDTHLRHDKLEIIVVDNASTDDSVAMVKKEFPAVTLIVNEKNLGFGAGNNVGVKHAQGEYVLFLNSDTLLDRDILADMLKVFAEKAEVAVVAGLLRNPDGTYQRAYGKFHTLPILFKALFLGSENEHTTSEIQKEGYVDWVPGACMMIRKNVFEKVQGFDEGYFMYIEDMDLCFRLREKGYKTYFLPQVEVLHIGQGSSNREFAILNIYKGLLYFYRQHKPFWQYVLVKAMLQIKAVLLVFYGSVTRNNYLRKTYGKALQF
jgi:GT2 family glycosyltransferase